VGEAMKKSELSLVHSSYENNKVEFYTSDSDPVCVGDIVSFLKKGEYLTTSGTLMREGGSLWIDCYKILIDRHVFYPVDGE